MRASQDAWRGPAVVFFQGLIVVQVAGRTAVESRTAALMARSAVLHRRHEDVGGLGARPGGGVAGLALDRPMGPVAKLSTLEPGAVAKAALNFPDLLHDVGIAGRLLTVGALSLEEL